MNTNNLVAEVTEILSGTPVDKGQLEQSFSSNSIVIVGGKRN